MTIRIAIIDTPKNKQSLTRVIHFLYCNVTFYPIDLQILSIYGILQQKLQL